MSTPVEEGLAGDPPPSDDRAGSRVGIQGWAPPTATGDPHSRDRRDSRREEIGQSHRFRGDGLSWVDRPSMTHTRRTWRSSDEDMA